MQHCSICSGVLAQAETQAVTVDKITRGLQAKRQRQAQAQTCRQTTAASLSDKGCTFVSVARLVSGHCLEQVLPQAKRLLALCYLPCVSYHRTMQEDRCPLPTMRTPHTFLQSSAMVLICVIQYVYLWEKHTYRWKQAAASFHAYYMRSRPQIVGQMHACLHLCCLYAQA